MPAAVRPQDGYPARPLAGHRSHPARSLRYAQRAAQRYSPSSAVTDQQDRAHGAEVTELMRAVSAAYVAQQFVAGVRLDLDTLDHGPE